MCTKNDEKLQKILTQKSIYVERSETVSYYFSE